MVLRLIDQVGIAHVAIGSDLTRNWDAHYVNVLRDGRWRPKQNAEWPTWPEWFSTPGDFPHLIDALAGSGLSESDLDALFGGNWLNLFAETFRGSS
jgi:microsomal dipeptidase-like Zn-dependent dipeptidase